MALAELCGMSDFDTFNREDNIHNEIVKMSNNFTLNTHLSVPPFANPAENLGHFSKDESGRDIKIKFDHGTTTLGFMYEGGVVLAVDSRATGGQFIGSQTMKKIVEINDFLLGMIV
jgi:20S proteasome subunit beta 5